MESENTETQRRIVKKPGITSGKTKALEDLVRAKTTGIRRSVQYEVCQYKKWFLKINS